MEQTGTSRGKAGQLEGGRGPGRGSSAGHEEERREGDGKGAAEIRVWLYNPDFIVPSPSGGFMKMY